MHVGICFNAGFDCVFDAVALVAARVVRFGGVGRASDYFRAASAMRGFWLWIADWDCGSVLGVCSGDLRVAFRFDQMAAHHWDVGCGATMALGRQFLCIHRGRKSWRDADVYLADLGVGR